MDWDLHHEYAFMHALGMTTRGSDSEIQVSIQARINAYIRTNVQEGPKQATA